MIGAGKIIAPQGAADDQPARMGAFLDAAGLADEVDEGEIVLTPVSLIHAVGDAAIFFALPRIPGIVGVILEDQRCGAA